MHFADTNAVRREAVALAFLYGGYTMRENAGYFLCNSRRSAMR